LSDDRGIGVVQYAEGQLGVGVLRKSPGKLVIGIPDIETVGALVEDITVLVNLAHRGKGDQEEGTKSRCECGMGLHGFLWIDVELLREDRESNPSFN
jgi:hypothetical protein